MEFIGTGKVLTSDDVTSAAEFLKVEVAALKAVIRVETSGRGFGKDMRPIILFEPHKFYQFTAGMTRIRAVREGLAYAVQGMKPYPASQRIRYEQLTAACDMDETAALKATSWGLGQIMGFNHLLADCDTPQVLVEETKKSEGVQLLLMVRVIKAMLLEKHLRSRNWTAFAKAYNGKNFAKNQYDEKLAAAYKSEIEVNA